MARKAKRLHCLGHWFGPRLLVCVTLLVTVAGCAKNSPSTGSSNDETRDGANKNQAIDRNINDTQLLDSNSSVSQTEETQSPPSLKTSNANVTSRSNPDLGTAKSDDAKFSDEAMVGIAMRQLNRLSELFFVSERDDVAQRILPTLTTDEFSCASLRPKDRERTYSESGFEIWKAGPQQQTDYRGRHGLQLAIANLVEAYDPASRPQISFHVYEVTRRAEEIETLVHMECHGLGPDGLVEQDAHWRVLWQNVASDALDASNEQPAAKMIRLETIDFEEIKLQSKSPWFSEQTSSVFAKSDTFVRQFALSNTYWRRRIERHHIIDKSGHHGIAIGDINRDGLDDVYVCQPGGLPNRLLVQNVDGTVRDISRQSNADFLDNTRSCLIIDFDNNGTQDLILATASGVLFLSNDGAGKFRLANNITKIVDAYGMAAADFDADGDLDIYACRYYQADANPLSLPIPTPYFDAENGGKNYLIRNDGDWRTTNATDEVGLGENNNRFSYAAIWLDSDRDGDQDLYVVNDFGRNNFFRNDGVRDGQVHFADVAMEIGMRDGAFGMSASGGDFDRDGWEDIYVGNMYSSAGSRISRMPDFKPDSNADDRHRFQHLARGNTLFRSQNGKSFRDVSVDCKVTMGRWSWGSLFIDIDNNGWQDLFVTNGYITGDNAQDDL